VLDPDVVFRVDAGRGPHARPPAVGAPAVARELLTRAPRFAPLAHPAIVNGAAGLYLGPAQRPAAVVGFTVVGGRIAAIDLIVGREKLRQVVGD
jgi:RNA polymerase sigma-70 factor (ECF subfamily)